MMNASQKQTLDEKPDFMRYSLLLLWLLLVVLLFCARDKSIG